MFPRSRTRRGVLATLALALALLLVATGCSGPGGDGPAEVEYTQADIDAALQEGGELTYWTWCPQCEGMAEEFEEQYPNVDITVENQGSSTDEYTAFQNVLAADSGIPDVIQLEMSAMPQFAAPGDAIVDLSSFGFAELEDSFTPAFWEASQFQGGLYGLPQDAGPLAMFYRQDVFEEFDLTVPTTWDEYVEAARTLHAADPNRFIAADAGDAGFMQSMIWQAGGRPFQVDGTSLSINFDDEGTQRFVEMWSPLVEEGLVDTDTAGFTPEWTAGLADGTYATWITGAWGSGTLQNRIPEASGQWRVAPLPQYTDGDTFVTSQNGGSLTAVTQASENPLLGAAFIQWMAATQEGSATWTGQDGFPCYAPTVESPEWLGEEIDYFGGEQANQVFAQSAASVGQGWQFLPFQPYAQSIFSDYIGGAYVGETDIQSGLQGWQEALLTYARSQGYETP